MPNSIKDGRKIAPEFAVVYLGIQNPYKRGRSYVVFTNEADALEWVSKRRRMRTHKIVQFNNWNPEFGNITFSKR